MEQRVKEVLSSFQGRPGELIPILQSVQAEFGYLPEPAMFQIARFVGITESQVYGVASFYAQFRLSPKGRNTVMACRGTACHVRGAPRILDEIEKVLGIKEGETTPDLEYTLETVACIGCCALSPCVMINKEVYAKLTPAKISKIFAQRTNQG